MGCILSYAQKSKRNACEFCKMVKRKVRPRLDDMLMAIDRIEDAIAEKDFGMFVKDSILKAAVERFIEVISEASKHIPLELTDLYPDVPWPDIRAIGNRLRHDYNRVEDAVIWRTATKSIPELKIVILAMIARVDRDVSGNN